MTKVHNLENYKFGDWTVLKFEALDKHGNATWKCQCLCGKVNVIASQYLKDGRSLRCRKCADLLRERKYSTGEIPYPLWVDISDNAKTRKLILDISKADAEELFKTQKGCCALSGLPISFAQTNKEYLMRKTTASLDRIDSLLGYTKNNIQWIHKDINKMKNNFNQTYFINMCKTISDHHGKD